MTTTNLTALEARYNELGEEIKRLKEAESAKTWPNDGDAYWSVDSGRVAEFLWVNDEFDGLIAYIGNIFRTQEEAEKELEARKVVAELKRQPGAKKFSLGEDNWSFGVDLSTMRMSNILTNAGLCDDGWHSIYFDSKESCKAAIKAVGESRIIAAAKWFAMGE